MNLVVLAGGRSRRMGLPKYRLRLGGMCLYEYPLRCLDDLYDRAVIVENEGLIQADEQQGRVVVQDIVPDAGPLGGIYSGLRASDAWLNLTVGADMPFVSRDLARAMDEQALRRHLDILVPNIDGLLEPLFSVYSLDVAAVAGSLLAAGIHEVRALFQSRMLRVGFVDRAYCERYDKRLLSFFNVNTPDDLVRADQIMHEEKNRQEEPTCT